MMMAYSLYNVNLSYSFLAEALYVSVKVEFIVNVNSQKFNRFVTSNYTITNNKIWVSGEGGLANGQWLETCPDLPVFY